MMKRRRRRRRRRRSSPILTIKKLSSAYLTDISLFKKKYWLYFRIKLYRAIR